MSVNFYFKLIIFLKVAPGVTETKTEFQSGPPVTKSSVSQKRVLVPVQVTSPIWGCTC